MKKITRGTIPTWIRAHTRGLRLVKKFWQCIGFASLILVLNFGELLGGGRDVRLHVPYRLTGIVLAQIADILILGMAIFVVMGSLDRSRFSPWIRVVLAVGLPPYLFFRMHTLLPFPVVDGMMPLVTVVWAMMVLMLLLVFPRGYRKLLRFGDVMGMFFGIFALAATAQMLWVIRWKPLPQGYDAVWTQTAQPARQHALLVWIVFDELSYDQVFEHRARDLQLPAFDELKAESTVFTNVQPIGLKTVKIIPSLLTGHTVDDFRFGLDNSFSVHYEDERGWHAIDGSQSVFADAQRNGWRTAAVGWYNPYCTIYRSVIDQCYWSNFDKIDGPMAQRKSFSRNVLAPLEALVREAKPSAPAGRAACSYDVAQRFQTHRDLEKHAFELLHTDQADFVFLHFSIPHSPNIWSRIDDDYTQYCDSSYIDNLALVDLELGKVLDTLKASPRWDQTSLIVEGDHSWRIHLWDFLPAWTDEDDHASHGNFDTRPALLIHTAGQEKGVVNQTSWPLIGVHTVVQDTLAGRDVKY